MKGALVLAIIAVGSSARADTTREAVDAKLAESLAGIKACGKSYRGTFDWASWNALDWSKTDREKSEALDYEKTSLESVGDGIDAACRDDADCKAVLGQVDAVVYRVTSQAKSGLSAKIEGTTLVFTNYPFAGTRFVDDFHREITRACEAAALPPSAGTPHATPRAATRAAAKQPAGRPSSAWDGNYRFSPGGGSGGLCPRAEGIDHVAVAGGKLSVPWDVDDWHRSDSWDHGFRIGRFDGIAHADGSVTATPELDAAIVKSRTVSTVKQKRLLDTASVAIRLSHGEAGDKVLALRVTFPDRQCEEEWHTQRPVIAATPRGPRTGSPSRGPARATPAPTPAPQRPAGDNEQERENRRSQCVSACWSVSDRCNDRCDKDNDAATRRCNDARSACNDQHDTPGCYDSDWSRCLSEANDTYHYTCGPRCKEDSQSCQDACNR